MGSTPPLVALSSESFGGGPVHGRCQHRTHRLVDATVTLLDEGGLARIRAASPGGSAPARVLVRLHRFRGGPARQRRASRRGASQDRGPLRPLAGAVQHGDAAVLLGAGSSRSGAPDTAGCWRPPAGSSTAASPSRDIHCLAHGHHRGCGLPTTRSPRPGRGSGARSSDFAGLIDTWDLINEVVIMPVFDRKRTASPGLPARRPGRHGPPGVRHGPRREPEGDAAASTTSTCHAEYEHLIEDCLAAGVAIDALGLQSHMHQGYWGEERTPSCSNDSPASACRCT